MKQMLNFIAVKKNNNIVITFVNIIMIKFNWRTLNNI